MQSKKTISEIDVDLVMEIICKYLKVDKSHVLAMDRYKDHVHARYLMFFFLTRIFKMEHSSVGDLFGVHQCSVFQGCNKVINDLVLYKDCKTEYNDIRSLIMKRMKDIIIIPTACAIKNGK